MLTVSRVPEHVALSVAAAFCSARSRWPQSCLQITANTLPCTSAASRLSSAIVAQRCCPASRSQRSCSHRAGRRPTNNP